MKGKVTADALTAVKMAIERNGTPRCGGGSAILAGSALSDSILPTASTSAAA